MRKHLFSYRDNMRVEVEQGISVTAKTVADLRMHFANYIVLGLLIAFMLGALSFTKKAAPISSTDHGGGKWRSGNGAIVLAF
jgi:hypothetical protein